MTPGMKFFFSRIFPFIFIAVGAGVLFFGVRGLIRAKASMNWPEVPGTVVSSRVDRQHSTNSDGRSSTTYHAEINYRYTVAGTTYHGSRVAYGDYGSSSSSHARKIVNRYPEGKKVTVRYMPEDPEECLLESGMKAQSWFMPVFGLVFFVIGCIMAVKLPGAMARQQEMAERAM
jgi:hypothetical protein